MRGVVTREMFDTHVNRTDIVRSMASFGKQYLVTVYKELRHSRSTAG